jgi:uncharacterized membrane protein
MTSDRAGIAGFRAAAVALTPVLLLVAFLWHPYLPGRLPNDALVAEAVGAGTTRWGLAHLAAGIAFGFAVLAFVAIHGYLRQTGGDRWSAAGLPFVVVGSALYTILPGMEFAPLAAVESGGDAEAAQAALQPWFVPVLIAGGVTFFVGVLCFVAGIARARLLGRGLAGIVIAGLVVMAASRLVPLAAFQLYVQGIAALVALWPLAVRMWRREH